uniref:Sosondowah ankyrin repeat domain family member A n=1 Tax=Amphiprion percula TaxID=161767 RepID=A0A3P8TIZ4_AMPPE
MVSFCLPWKVFVLPFTANSQNKSVTALLFYSFKDSVDSVDPAEKQRNRELFKTFVNNLASVKEIDGVRYVVLRKTYHHLLQSVQTIPLTGEQQRPPARSDQAESCEDAGGKSSAVPEPDPKEHSESPAELLSPIQQALRRSKYKDVRVKRMLNFEIVTQDANGDHGSNERKPYRRPASVETGGGVSSPQLRRAVKSTKASEEPKESRIPSGVPLDQSEHEWLVKCAAGHWSQVYGLLLRDNQLAEKRDFMSGFTALHWAAKCGNSHMLVKIIDLSKQGGVDIDINVKAHGGYTPLHIAALHDQEYIMAMLVGEYGADVSVRDNCGKKAYHYLHKGIARSVREMLGEPKARQAQDGAPPEKEELEMFPDLPKSLHSISRLFQPNTTSHKKKHKQRLALYSLNDDPSEEREDGGFRHRLASDVFM